MKSESIEVARTSRDSMKEIITRYVVAPGTSHGDCSVLSGRSRAFSSRKVQLSVWTIQRISVGAIRLAKGTKSQRRVTDLTRWPGGYEQICSLFYLQLKDHVTVKQQ